MRAKAGSITPDEQIALDTARDALVRAQATTPWADERVRSPEEAPVMDKKSCPLQADRTPVPSGRTTETSAQVVLDLLKQMGGLGAILWPHRCAPLARAWSSGKSYVLSDRSCTCPVDEYRRDAPCKHRQTLAIYRQFVLTYLGHVRAFRCLCAARFPKEQTPHDNVRELRAADR